METVFILTPCATDTFKNNRCEIKEGAMLIAIARQGVLTFYIISLMLGVTFVFCAANEFVLSAQIALVFDMATFHIALLPLLVMPFNKSRAALQFAIKDKANLSGAVGSITYRITNTAMRETKSKLKSVMKTEFILTLCAAATFGAVSLDEFNALCAMLIFSAVSSIYILSKIKRERMSRDITSANIRIVR